MSERMTSEEATRLWSAMTPGTLEVMEIRDGRLTDAAAEELAVVIRDDARAHEKPDGTWHTVIVCRGMDGPTRAANAEAMASAKRALLTVADLEARIERACVAAVLAERGRCVGIFEAYAADAAIAHDVAQSVIAEITGTAT